MTAHLICPSSRSETLRALSDVRRSRTSLTLGRYTSFITSGYSFFLSRKKGQLADIRLQSPMDSFASRPEPYLV